MTSITIDCGTGNNGNGNSTYNTPQAKDDAYADGENTVATLNVMSNDLGGNAKTLYSVDQDNPAVVQTAATSDMGASIKIVNGQIVYDPTGSAAIQALSQGQTAVDTFSYTIRLANGTLSVATVKVTITGANDAPILSADTSGPHTLVEHAGVAGSAALDTSSATLNFADVDLLDTHTVSVGSATAVWSGGSALPSGLQAVLNGAVKASEYDSNILTQTQAAASAATSGILGALGSILSGGSLSGAVGQAANGLSTAASLYHPGTGSISLAFSAVDSAFDFLAAGETLKVTYNITVTDNHGASSTQPVTFTITGTNDTPVLSADAVANHALTERAATTGSATADVATATLNFSDADLSDTHTVSIGTAAATWSGGSALPTGVQAKLNAALTAAVADSTHTGSGSVGLTFSSADSAFDFLGAGETLKVTYNVTVTDNNGATSTQPVTFTVTGTNDAPVLSPDRVAVHGMSEQDGVTAGSGSESASTTLNFSDADLNDTHAVSVSNASVVWSGGSALPAGLQSALNSALSTTLNDSTHSGSGSVGVAFSAADKAFDFLSDGETLRVAYNVTVTDSQGVASTRTVTFVVTGTNDAPVLAADSSGAHAMTEIAGVTNGSGVESASATLAFTDVDLNDSHGVIVSHTGTVWSGGSNLPAGLQAMLDSAAQGAVADSTGTGSGAINVTFSAADHAFDFLGAGETLTVKYSVMVLDTLGAISTQPVTFTVTGTNDAPVLAAGVTASFAEQAGQTGASAGDFAAAFVGFTDTDLTDTHTVAITGATASWSGGSALPTGLQAILDGAVSTHLSDSTQFGNGTVRVDFGAADNTFDFLSAGETLTVTYNLTVTDSQGASSTQPVTFTVTGTNDSPVLAADASGAHALTEQSGVTAGSGIESAAAALTFTDVDLNDTHGVSVTHAGTAWSGGSALPAGLQAMLDNAAQASISDSAHTGSGSVAVAFAAADNAFDFLAAGETLTVTYNVTVTDSQGATSTQPVTFTVTGTNDAPVLNTDTSGAHAMTEVAGVTNGSGIESAAAALTFTDVDLDDSHSVSVAHTGTVWSGGSALPAGLQAMLDNAAQVAGSDSTHTGSGAVAVAFAAADNAFDFLGAGETLTVTYNVTVTDSQGASSVQPVTFTVTGTDDAPVLAAQNGVQSVPGEIDGVTGSAAADGAMASLLFSDVDLNDAHTASIGAASATWSGGSALPAGLQAVLDNAAQAAVGADSTGGAFGRVDVTFAAADNAFDFLSAGETLTVTYNVTVADGHGGTSVQPVTFVVTGTNDAPVLAADTGANAITELAGATGSAAADGAATTLAFTDVDLNDTHSVSVSGASAAWTGGSTLPAGLQAVLDGAVTTNVTDSAHSGSGSVGVAFAAADNAFDFLAAGETLTVTYNVTVTDAQGAASSQTVTFTVTGTNDAPVLAADTGPHALTELAGAIGSAAQDVATTTLNFTDVDLTDTHSIGVSGAQAAWSGGAGLPSGLQAVLDNALHVGGGADSTGTGSGSVVLNFAAADGSFDFLSAGETLTVTYNVVVRDSQGATSTQPVTFVVTGTNDAPVLAADTGAHALGEQASVTGSSATDISQTVLTFTDADLTDTHTATVGAPTAVWSGGTLPSGLISALAGAVTTSVTDTGTGSGSLTAAFAAADRTFDFLAAGETLQVTYNVTIDDGHGATSTRPVTFTVTGTNDAPVLAADTGSHAAAESGAATQVATSQLAFTDVDLTDSHTVSNFLTTVAWSAGGSVPSGSVSAIQRALSASVVDGHGASADGVILNFALADSAVSFLAAGETLTATYHVTVNDGHGGGSSQDVTFTVTGTNDAPVLAADTGTHAVSEVAGVTAGPATDTVSAILSFTDADLTDTHTATVGAPTAVWSGGTLPSGLISALTGAVTTSVTDTGTGSGSLTAAFAAADRTFDFLAAGETLQVTYNVTIDDGHGATSTRPVTFTVTGTNDAPVLAADTGSHAAAESGAATQVATSQLAFTDVDLTDSHTVSNFLTTVAWSAGGSVPSGSVSAIQHALSASVVDGHGASADGVILNFALADSAVSFLAAGETLTATYHVTVSDGHGGGSSQDVTFTVTGTNDAPVLSAAPSSPQTAETFTFESSEGGVNTYGGAGYYTLTDRDFTFAGLEDYTYSYGNPGGMAYTYGHTALPSGANTEWHRTDGKEFSLQSFDMSGYSYTAGSFTVVIKGYDHGTLVATKTVTEAFGANYATAYQTIAFDSSWTTIDDVQFTFTGMPSDVFFDNVKVGPPLAGGGAVNLLETTGATGSTAALAGSTSLTFTDVDLTDHHTASVSAPTAVWSGGSLPAGVIAALTGALTTTVTDSTGTGSGSLAANFQAQDHTFDFLAAGETLTVTYNITVDDGHGGTSTQPVTITVTGTNDVPVVAADPVVHAAAESGSGTQVASSTLTFTDADLNDSHTVSASFVGATWSTGGAIPAANLAAISIVLSDSVSETHGTGAGQVNLSLNLNDSVVSFLAAGETLTATYNVTVNDGHGGTSSQHVSYTFTGVNSAPVLTAGGVNLITNGGFESGATGWSNTGSGGVVEVNPAGTYGVSGFSGNVLEIDANGGLPVDDVSQVVTTTGGTYTLSFDTADRTGTAASTNTFQVYWNGQLIDTVTPASTVAEHHSYTVTGTGSTGKLEFVEINSDGAGGIVDNVSLVQINTTAMAEQANLTGSTTLDTATYAFKLTDANYTDTHTASVSGATAVWSGGTISAATQSALDHAVSAAITADSGNGATGGVSVSFSAQDSAFDFLGQGETLQVTYNVTVADNHGGATTQPVTFTVTGTNDAPVIAADTGAHTVSEQAAQLGSTTTDTANATLTFTDVDLTDTHTTSISAATAVWSGGSALPSGLQAVLNNAVHATETDSTGSGSGSVALAFLAADSSFDFLAAGETLQVTYNVTVADTHGGTSTKPVTFTVTGANDAPALAAGPNLSGAVSFYGAEGNLVDTVGNNNGTNHGVAYTTGHDGLAFNFTGSNYATIGNIIPADFTMSGWLKTTANSLTGTQFYNGNGLVYADVGGLAKDFGVSILNNHLAFGTGGNFDSTIQSTSVVNTGNWVNWAVTRSGSIISIYINGVLEASEDTTYAGLLNSPTVITLGANTVDGRYFVGQLDDLAIYNRALSATEIQQHSVLGSASVVEIAGQTGSTTVTSASVSLTLTDADLTDTHTVALGVPTLSWSGGTVPAGLAALLTASAAVTADTAGTGVGSVTVSMSAQDHVFDFLGYGETLTITYNATVSDGHGGVTTQPATFTVTGNNDSPTISAPTNVMVADTAGAVKLGLVASDPDTNDILSITIDSLTGGVGTLKLADGTVVSVGQALTAAQLAGLTLTAASGGLTGAIHYTVADNHGGSYGVSEAISTYTSLAAGSEVLTFDDLGGAAIPSGYGASGTFQGFVFNSIGDVAYPNPYSSPNTLYPYSAATDTSITSVGGTEFHLNGFEIARQWSTSQVVVTFKDGATVVGSQTVNLPGADSSNTWVYVQGPSSNITEIDIHSNVGGWWKADNISVSWGTAATATETGSTTGSNLIAGGTGNDVLTGTTGSDTFVFNSVHFGQDTVNAFTAGVDLLQIDHTVFANATTALSHAAQVGSDVVITYDAADIITLKGVLLANLHATDFHIV